MIQDRIIDVRRVRLGDILPNEKNWRKHGDGQRKAFRQMVDSVGYVGASLVRELDDGRLKYIDGHMRSEEFPEHEGTVLVTDLTEAEADALLATFDSIAGMADPDAEMLEGLLRDVSASFDDLDAVVDSVARTFDIDLSAGTEPQEAPEAQMDRAEELLELWQVRRGDVWEIPSQHGGVHRLMCADCVDIDNIDILINGADVSYVFSDPPYGINIVAANVSVGGGEAYNIPFGGVKNRKGLGTSNGSKPFGSAKVRGTVGASNLIEAGKYFPVAGDDSIDTAIESSSIYLELFPSAVQVWWGGNYYAHKLPPSSCWVVWNKENTGNFADCELAWTNQKKAVRMFTHQWNGMLRESERGRRWHPTQKPAALAQWCFETYGNEGDVIADPFSGSGPSFVAAEATKRTVCGFELSEEYCAVILQRMADMGLEPMRVVEGAE